MDLPCIAMKEPPKSGEKTGSQMCIQEFRWVRNPMGTKVGQGALVLGTAGPCEGWGWHWGSLALSPALRGRAWGG